MTMACGLSWPCYVLQATLSAGERHMVIRREGQQLDPIASSCIQDMQCACVNTFTCNDMLCCQKKESQAVEQLASEATSPS